MSEEPELIKKAKVEAESGVETIELIQTQGISLNSRLSSKREQFRSLKSEMNDLKKHNQKLSAINTRLKSNWSNRYKGGSDEVLSEIFDESRSRLGQLLVYMETKLSEIGKGQTQENVIMDLNSKIDGLNGKLQAESIELNDSKEQASNLKEDAAALSDEYRAVKERYSEMQSRVETLQLRLKRARGQDIPGELDSKQLAEDIIAATAKKNQLARHSHKLDTKFKEDWRSYKEMTAEKFIKSKAFRFLVRQARHLNKLIIDEKDFPRRRSDRRRRDDFEHDIREPLDHIRDRNHDLSHKLEKVQTQLVETKALDTYAKTFDEYQELITEAEHEIEVLKERKKKQEVGNNALSDKNSKIQRQISALQAQMSEKEERIRNMESSLGTTSDDDEVAKMKCTIKMREDKVTYLETLRKHLDTQYRNEQAINTLMQKEIDELEKAYSDSQKKHKTLTESLAAKDQEFAQLMSERLKDANIKDQHEKQKSELTEKLRVYKSQIEDCKTKVSELEKKLSENDAVRMIEDGIASVDDKIHSLQSSSTAHYIAELEYINDTMKKGITNIEKKLTVNQEDIQTIQNEISAKDTEIISLESKIKQAKDYIHIRSKDQELNQQLDKYRAMTVCQMCKINPKDAVLQTCFHTFCADCLKKRIVKKSGKCYICKEKFKLVDIKPLYWK